MGIEVREGIVEQTDTARPGKQFIQFLENVGSKIMNVDGSVTPVTFTAAPPTGKTWFVHTITLVIEDGAIQFPKFGGINALTNGLDIKVKESGLAEETLANIKKNSEFYTFASGITIESAGVDLLIIHFRIKINSGTTFQLTDSNSEFFKAIVNDDLTSIDNFNMLIRGYEVDE